MFALFGARLAGENQRISVFNRFTENELVKVFSSKYETAAWSTFWGIPIQAGCQYESVKVFSSKYGTTVEERLLDSLGKTDSNWFTNTIGSTLLLQRGEDRTDARTETQGLILTNPIRDHQLLAILGLCPSGLFVQLELVNCLLYGHWNTITH